MQFAIAMVLLGRIAMLIPFVRLVFLSNFLKLRVSRTGTFPANDKDRTKISDSSAVATQRIA